MTRVASFAVAVFAITAASLTFGQGGVGKTPTAQPRPEAQRRLSKAQKIELAKSKGAVGAVGLMDHVSLSPQIPFVANKGYLNLEQAFSNNAKSSTAVMETEGKVRITINVAQVNKDHLVIVYLNSGAAQNLNVKGTHVASGTSFFDTPISIASGYGTPAFIVKPTRSGENTIEMAPTVRGFAFFAVDVSVIN